MLLDGHALNAAALNSSPLIVTEGAANFTPCVATFTSAARVNHAATSGASGAATMGATAVRQVRPTAGMSGVGSVYNTTVHIKHAARGDMLGRATVSPAPTRIVYPSASVSGTADIEAYGQTSDELIFFGESDLSGTLTYIHRIPDLATPGVPFSGTGTLANSAALVTRWCAANFPCTGKLTGAHDVTPSGQSYKIKYVGAYPAGRATLSFENSYIFYNKSAIFRGDAGFALSANEQLIFRITPSSGAISATCSFVATAERRKMASAAASGACTVSAAALRNVMPSATMVAGAGFTSASWQRHAGHVHAIIGEAALTPNEPGITVDTFGQASFGGSGAFVNATALVIRYVTASFPCSGDVLAYGVIKEKTFAFADVVGLAELGLNPHQILQPNAQLPGACTIYAFARSNMDADDPPERTMRRPYSERELRRPFVDRTMREAA